MWNFVYDSVKPRGWLRRQLEIQADGLSGNLDKVWRDIRDSAWIGGGADGWERVPYWLDGFIPLAFLLDDEDKKSRAKKYIDAILDAQRRDGWICPCKTGEIASYDTWSLQLLSKVLSEYYVYTGEERVLNALYDAMKNYYDLLQDGTIRLFDWGKARWFEACIAIRLLYGKFSEPWLPELAKMLKDQGTDYREHMSEWRRPLNRWTFETHVVNLAMMLKSEAVSCDLLGESYTGSASELLSEIDRFNSTAAGVFTGDECLSGHSPIQGTELCAVAELMYSLELLYAFTGENKWAERLEKVAFNALPATLSDDMWAHQYDQMANQIACVEFPGRSVFRTNGPQAHLFGLEPNFGCCTANFNQAWPKLARSAFLCRDDVILQAIPIPSSLRLNGISVDLDTRYPFENILRYRVKTDRAFTLQVRIPSFARDLTVDGVPYRGEGDLRFSFEAGGAGEFEIAFSAEAHLNERPHDMASVEWGSLVFALPIRYSKKQIEYEKEGVERKYPYCDYEYIPQSEWRYALCGVGKKPRAGDAADEYPFSSINPPLKLSARVQRIDWEKEDGFDTVCAAYPQSRVPIAPPEAVDLIPYGCAKLRITELPKLP